MTRAPFAPKRERPAWEYVYDLLSPLDVGDLVTHDEIAKALDLTREEFATQRGPFYKAANVWGAERKRALRSIPGEGYRVVDAPEHEQLAKAHHRKSRRSLARGRKVLTNTDRSRLDDEQKVRFDALEANIARQEDMIRRLDSRTTKVEKAVAAAKQQHTVTEERVAALEDALRRHGINPAQSSAPGETPPSLGAEPPSAAGGVTPAPPAAGSGTDPAPASTADDTEAGR